jgi:hypothetical protein
MRQGLLEHRALVGGLGPGVDPLAGGLGRGDVAAGTRVPDAPSTEKGAVHVLRGDSGVAAAPGGSVESYTAFGRGWRGHYPEQRRMP